MTDITAIAGIKDHNEGSVNEIIVKYSKYMWPVAYAVLKNIGSEQDVEHCIAGVFVDLWEEPDQYDPQSDSLQDWLCTKVRSRAMERYRVLSGSGAVPLDGPMMMGRMGMRDPETLEKNKREVAAAVRSLSHTEQDVLIRRFYYEQTIKEIAVALNLSRKQIRDHLHHSKQLLQKAFLRRS